MTVAVAAGYASWPSSSACNSLAEIIGQVAHNYGHSGASLSLSWDCATEITDLISTRTSPHTHQSMRQGWPGGRRRRCGTAGCLAERDARHGRRIVPDTAPVDTFWSVLGLLATAIAAVGAIGSWWSARHSSAAATAVARIEQDRRHVELTPQLEVDCRVTYGDRARLWLAFTGPPGTDHLDAVTIAIRDDRHDREPIVAGGPTAEEIAQVVWGPYRFVPHTHGSDRSGRAIAPFALNRGDWTQRELERTTAPHWADHDFWSHQYDGKPVRLKITCRQKGDRPWVIPIEIEVEQGDGTR